MSKPIYFTSHLINVIAKLKAMFRPKKIVFALRPRHA